MGKVAFGQDFSKTVQNEFFKIRTSTERSSSCPRFFSLEGKATRSLNSLGVVAGNDPQSCLTCGLNSHTVKFSPVVKRRRLFGITHPGPVGPRWLFPISLPSKLIMLAPTTPVFALSHDGLSAQHRRVILISGSGTILGRYNFCSHGSLAKTLEGRP